MMKKWKLGMLVAAAALSVVALAGCTAGKSSSGADDKNVTMWVQFSKEDPEGKAMAQNIAAFNKENKKGTKPLSNIFPGVVPAAVMKTRSTRR